MKVNFIAYKDNQVIAFCNVNDRKNYSRLNKEMRPDLWKDYNSERVKTIVCFTVAPMYRRQGVTSELLEFAVNDAKRDGYDDIEGYPDLCGHGYHGKMTQYEKLGFIKVESMNHNVVRKYLK
jgi:GNAT superfamily N-acetyltransferase